MASRRGPVRFDWADRQTWEPAVSGIEAVYVVDSSGPEASAEVEAFAAVAAGAGVRRLVLLSARVFGEMAGEGLLGTEDAVKASGLEWTILRPTWFAQNFTEERTYFGTLWDGSGELRLPTGGGREAFVDLEDLADVAAAASTQDGHAGRTYVLSGPRSLTFGEAVGVPEASGRPFSALPSPRMNFVPNLPPPGGRTMDPRVLSHICEGTGAEPVGGVREALGRAPRDFFDYVKRTDFSSL